MNRDKLPLLIAAVLAVAVVAAVMLFGPAEGLAQATGTIVALQQMKAGAAPTEFDFAHTGQGGPGRWTVVDDAGDRAIEQTSTDTTDYRFPLAIYGPLSAKNVAVAVRFKAVAGKVDQAGGIAVRLSDSNNYYVVRANALEDNVRFYRMVKGRREQIAGVDTKVTANEWHTLGLRADGERFTITFDGKTLYTATDKTISAAGKVALWTKADSVTRFDQIEVRTMP
jgi:hypothetical protein